MPQNVLSMSSEFVGKHSLQDKRNFVAIMKEGAFHQTAPLAVAA